MPATDEPSTRNDALLQEYVDSRGVAMRVDRQASMIRGVKILGLESRNQRTYLAAALADAAGLYEAAKVNVNHPKGHPQSPRDYQDRIGVLRQVAFRPAEGLFGDLQVNPKHALAEQLFWDALHAPENVGFSHNVQARTSVRDGQTFVEAITAVHSVDLVADPATTRGLFEAAGGASLEPPAGASGTASGWENITLTELCRRRPDLVEALVARERDEQKRLREELDRVHAVETVRTRRALVQRLLAQFGLPPSDDGDPTARGIVSRQFLESLFAAPAEAAVRELVAERAALVAEARRSSGLNERAARPRSQDQFAPEWTHARPTDVEAFVRAIT